MQFSGIEEAVEDVRSGKPLIIIDDESRENEGDLMVAAQKATPEKINFMIKKAGGLICVPILGSRLDELKIPLMVAQKENTEVTRCKFTVSVDYKHGTTTGISASDRAKTINALANPVVKPDDFAHPGHIFPLRYQEGGVLKRDGHTEAAVDLCKLAGLYPAGVICEILKEDGETAKLKDLEKFAQNHNIKIITIKSLIEYRKQKSA